MMSALYVFALTGHTTAPFTVRGHRIEFLDVADMHAAVESRSEPLSMSESSLRDQHDIVVRLFEQIEDVLPARFGAMIEERELRDIMTARRSVIHDALALVRGRVQMTVRFRDAIEPMPRRDLPVAPDPQTGTAYLEARRKASRTMPALAGLVTKALADLTLAERSEAGTERAQAVLYHLIRRGDVARYLDAVSRLQSPAVNVTGPWPPFAFAPDLWP